jgi:stage V sporulation protein B
MTANKPVGGFVKQAVILGAASLFVRMMGFFFRVPLTNMIGDVGNAFYNQAYQIFLFVLNLTSVFMTATLARLISERIARGEHRNAHTLFTTALFAGLGLGTAGALFMFFGAEILVDLFNFRYGAIPAVRAIAPAIFICALLTVLRGYFQGMQTTIPTAISQVIEQVFNVSFSLWLAWVFLNASGVHYAAAGATAGTAIAAGAALSVMFIIYLKNRRKIHERVDADKHSPVERRGVQLAAIGRIAWPIILGLIIFVIATNIDIGMANSRILASGAYTQEQIDELVGMFTGKFLVLTTLPVSLSMALALTVMPEITQEHTRGNPQGVRALTNSALRLSMVLAIPAAVGLAVLADPILRLLFPAFPEGGWLLRFGSSSIIFLSLVHVVTGVLQGVGHVRLPVIGLAVGIIAKIGLNYWLMAIPDINILGAVLSTIACFAIAAAILFVFLYKRTGIVPEFLPAFGKPAFAAAGMGAACLAVYHFGGMFLPGAIATMMALGLGLTIYVAILALICPLARRDLARVVRRGNN